MLGGTQASAKAASERQGGGTVGYRSGAIHGDLCLCLASWLVGNKRENKDGLSPASALFMRLASGSGQGAHHGFPTFCEN